ncbi:hypothetical protein CUMW_196200 [Citrus unshiu]|nr:hypothetical protein CUMW_196200 [Citrus unshiu]
MIRNLKTQLRFAFYHSQLIQNLYNEVLVAFDFLQNNANFRTRPNTYADLISACSSLRSLQLGRKVHDHILSSKCQPDVVLHNHILNMYGKCGSLEDARMVFDEMPLRNVIESPDLASWNAIIAGVARAGCMHEADDFINQMAFDADIVEWKSLLRGSMKERGVRKVPDDVMHPERDKIYTILEELWLQMLDEGYVSIHMLASTEQLQWSNKLPPHYSTK